MEGIKFRGRAEQCLSWVNLDGIEQSASCPDCPRIATVELTSRFGSVVPSGSR